MPNEDQDMVRPLTFRHPTFHGNDEHARDRLLQFARLLDNNDPDATKAPWIRSVWFHKERYMWGEHLEWAVIRRKVRTATISLLGKLRPLGELSCRQYINAENLETIAHHHGSSLEKMAVQTYQGALPTLVLLMGQFLALQDLYLLVHAVKNLVLKGKPDLPKFTLSRASPTGRFELHPNLVRTVSFTQAQVLYTCDQHKRYERRYRSIDVHAATWCLPEQSAA